MRLATAQEWERWWAPYDEPTYQAVLSHVRSDDIVFEIGAGDLRLARRLAAVARRVYAIELYPTLIARALIDVKAPDNLHAVCGDARRFSFPHGITVGVLLMRHCQHFGLYADKLADAGARRLITNARWRLDVEVVDLTLPGVPFDDVRMGWYACRCGATGFIPGPPEQLTPALEATIHQVSHCPLCEIGE